MENTYETNAARHIADSYETKPWQSHYRFAFDVVFCAFANSRTGWQPAWFANTRADTNPHNHAIADADIPPTPIGDRGNGNTAIGNESLLSLTTGTYNAAMGYQALSANTTGNGNIASGR